MALLGLFCVTLPHIFMMQACFVTCRSRYGITWALLCYPAAHLFDAGF
jgi:hypothetical protein